MRQFAKRTASLILTSLQRILGSRWNLFPMVVEERIRRGCIASTSPHSPLPSKQPLVRQQRNLGNRIPRLQRYGADKPMPMIASLM